MRDMVFWLSPKRPTAQSEYNPSHVRWGSAIKAGVCTSGSGGDRTLASPIRTAMARTILDLQLSPLWRIRRPCRELALRPRSRRPRQLAEGAALRHADWHGARWQWRPEPEVPRVSLVSNVPTLAEIDEMIAALPWPDV